MVNYFAGGVGEFDATQHKISSAVPAFQDLGYCDRNQYPMLFPIFTPHWPSITGGISATPIPVRPLKRLSF
jgi:hypothetical protein